MSEALLDNRERAIALLDVYEALLTSKQKKAMDDYYRYDLSLAEIAEAEGVSRTAVLDAIQKSLAKLNDFEDKLGLIAKKETIAAALAEARALKDPAAKCEAYENIMKGIENGV
ncbi:MAG: hypothetical protein HUJ60_01455 [Bacilli bacterium]|nr:hypothetical protein [Bacilli bacterium]